MEKILETNLRSWNTPIMAEKYHAGWGGMLFLEGSEICKYQMLIGCLNYFEGYNSAQVLS